MVFQQNAAVKEEGSNIFPRHCEEQRDEAIHASQNYGLPRALQSLAMTKRSLDKPDGALATVAGLSKKEDKPDGALATVVGLSKKEDKPDGALATVAGLSKKEDKPDGALATVAGLSKKDNPRLTPLLKWANELGKSSLLENKRRRQAQWTSEKRQKQSEIIKAHKPWLKTKGPKTEEGKARSAQNAYKHGFYDADMKYLDRLLRAQKRYVADVLEGARENYRHYLQTCAMQAAMDKPLNAVVQHIKSFLSEGGFDVPMREIKMMIEHVTGYGEETHITKPDAPVTTEQQDQLMEMAQRRKAGEPVTRILGVREFWGLEFEVTKDTLDPRPDTETLVEAALKWVKQHPKNAARVLSFGSTEGSQTKLRDPAIKSQDDNPNNVIARNAVTKQSTGEENGLPRRSDDLLAMTKKQEFRILDLGTGTGCIPIALLSELPNATAVAVDYSYEAALVARRNAEKHKMSDRFHIVQGDWMEALKPGSFNLIVSNPPYISNEVIQNLDDEVKNHDPFLSLSGGDSGLDAYKKIIFALKNNLNGENRAFLEIGFDQLESVSRLVDDSNLRLCDSYRDLAGNPRVVEIARGDKWG